jgi:hypothetical protein
MVKKLVINFVESAPQEKEEILPKFIPLIKRGFFVVRTRPGGFQDSRYEFSRSVRGQAEPSALTNESAILIPNVNQLIHPRYKYLFVFFSYSDHGTCYTYLQFLGSIQGD